MRKLQLVSSSLAATALGVSLGACDNPASRNPINPEGPAIVEVQLHGPDTLAPGQSAEYIVDVHHSDGTRKTGPPTAANLRWLADDHFLRVDASGVVTAQQRVGDTVLRVNVVGRPLTSVKEITIVPMGTFRVAGRVADAELPSTPVPGAHVEVVGTSTTATTDVNGRYRLYGVPSDATIRVSRDGYQSAEQRLQLGAHATHDFHLPVAGTRLVLSDNYTLQIQAIGGCSLPSDLQLRRYDARVAQDGMSLGVTLTEDRFRLNRDRRGNRFTGQVIGSSATFTLLDYGPNYNPYYNTAAYPDVAEQLPDGNVLVLQGVVVTSGTSSQLSGQLSGGLTQWSSGFPFGTSSMGSCGSILFTLSSR